MKELVLVIDFGGPYKELVARLVRELKVYSEIKPGSITAEEVRQINPIGIIITGGAVAGKGDFPSCDPKIMDLGIPVLGICTGMHLMCTALGGTVSKAEVERGKADMVPTVISQGVEKSKLIIDKAFRVFMNNEYAVTSLPAGFTVTGKTEKCAVAAFENSSKNLFGIQFHPESDKTQEGKALIKKFLDICSASYSYTLDAYIEAQIKDIREKVQDRKVLLALSGGVDSSVCAALLSKAIPNQAVCVFVDHGFMRLNEGDEIEQAFSRYSLSFVRVNAQDRFLSRLKGVTDPEEKRKRVGNEFIRVFEEQAGKLDGIDYLAQGTIYPDIVESGGAFGKTIKSHHNVGGLPETLDFKGIIEPLAGLFKDEVRALGAKLGLPQALVSRQPFPGPGLSVRVTGEVTWEKLETLRLADHIVRSELDALDERPQQYFAVITNTLSVGAKNGVRTYEPVVAVRAVLTNDFMTCEYAKLPHDVLGKIATRITTEVPSVSRVVYDITSKPPGTIEWE